MTLLYGSLGEAIPAELSRKLNTISWDAIVANSNDACRRLPSIECFHPMAQDGQGSATTESDGRAIAGG